MAVLIDAEDREWVSADAMDKVISQRNALLEAVEEIVALPSNMHPIAGLLIAGRMYPAGDPKNIARAVLDQVGGEGK